VYEKGIKKYKKMTKPKTLDKANTYPQKSKLILEKWMNF